MAMWIAPCNNKPQTLQKDQKDENNIMEHNHTPKIEHKIGGIQNSL